jgi:hypothetical protein
MMKLLYRVRSVVRQHPAWLGVGLLAISLAAVMAFPNPLTFLSLLMLGIPGLFCLLYTVAG